MNTRTIAAALLSLIVLAGTIHAQEDHLIENQRTNIIYDTTWGDTYLGKYTSNNDLQVTNSSTLTSADSYIGVSDLASSNTAVVVANSKWLMDSLQIGSTNNTDNSLVITSGGTVEIEGSLAILGATNGNALLLSDGGTLYMKSDFDAATEGFFFDTNTTLKVGGTLNNLAEVEGQRDLFLIGPEAQWLHATNTVYVGANTDLNTLSLEDGANIAFTNLFIGNLGTTGNVFTVSGDAQATIASNLWLQGTNNSVDVAGGSIDVGNFEVLGNGNSVAVAGGSIDVGSFEVLGNSNSVAVAGGSIDAGSFEVLGTSNSVEVAGGSINVEGILHSDSIIQFSGSGLVTAHGDVTLPGLDGTGTMVLTGENARWTNNTDVKIGFTEGDSTLILESNALMQVESVNIGSNSVGNSVVLQDDGKLIIAGDGSFLGDDNSLIIDDGGWLTFESDISTAISVEDNASFYWNTGGTVEFQGEAPVFEGWEVNGEYLEVGTLFLGRGRTMILNGSNAYWAAGNHNFHLGDLSSDNTLIVSNGASASFKSVSIGDFEEGGNDNLMLVSGNDTVVTSEDFTAIGGTMIGGTWNEGGNNNILRVEDGALLFSPGALHNRNTTGTSGLEIASGALVEVDSYYQSSGAYLIILTDSSGTNTGLLRANTAEFEAGARLGVDAVSELTIGQGYTNMIIETTGTLIVGGVTNATTDDLSLLADAGGSLVTYNLWETNQNIYATFVRRSISEGAGIDPDSMLGMISTEIDRLASEGNVAASNQVQTLSAMDNDQEQKLQLEQLYSYELPTYMHSRGVFGGIDQVRARGLSSQEPSRQELSYRPRGAAGPHSADQGLQGWAKVYGNFGSRDGDDGSSFVDGYDAQTYGTVIGFDQAFGGWLFGLAGGYAGSTLEGDNGDESDGKTGYGILYANYGTNDWFGNVGLAYGLTDIDNTSGTDFGVSSTTKASQSAFYISGGYQFEDEPTGALLRPSLGIQTGLYDQDAYTETGNGLKEVDAFDRWSAVSSLGAAVIYPKSGDKVDTELLLRAFWLHEFNGDDEQVGYTLAGSDVRGQFVMRSPDQDVAQFGLGYVAKGKNGWQLRGDIDLQLSETYTSTTLSGALLYEF